MPSLRKKAGDVSVPLAFLLLAAACGSAPAPRTASVVADSNVVWDYDVAVDAALDLDVHATFRGALRGAVSVDDDAVSYADGFAVAEGSSWRPIDPKSFTCADPCVMHYRVHLRAAATAIHDGDTAILAGGAIFAPPSTWLARPANATGTRYRFRVTPSSMFATGVRKSGDAYEADTSTIDEATYAAFGSFRLRHVADPEIDAVLTAGLPLSDDEATAWLAREVKAIADYVGRPPDGHATLFIAPGTSEQTRGKTLGDGGAAIFVQLGTSVTSANIGEDWVVAHELIHVSFPRPPRRYSWFAEGLATWVEPIARARAGMVAPEKVWADVAEGLPQGLPKPGEGGLDGTREWGRVYWGGALYFLLADLGIREETKNARSLEDAIRGIVATGGNVETPWTLERILDTGDAATGTHVMRRLYDRFGLARGTVDVADLLTRLGVHVDHGVTQFDPHAPLAQVRESMTRARK